MYFNSFNSLTMNAFEKLQKSIEAKLKILRDQSYSSSQKNQEIPSSSLEIYCLLAFAACCPFAKICFAMAIA